MGLLNNIYWGVLFFNAWNSLMQKAFHPRKSYSKVYGLGKTVTVKPVLRSHSKIGFQDRLSLNVGQTYCRKLSWSILQYFSYHLSLRPLFFIFLSDRLRQDSLNVDRLLSSLAFNKYHDPLWIYRKRNKYSNDQEKKQLQIKDPSTATQRRGTINNTHRRPQDSKNISSINIADNLRHRRDIGIIWKATILFWPS